MFADIVAQVFIAASFAVTTVWFFQYREGFSASAQDYPFNYHPFFMTLGFIVLMGEAIVLWEPISRLQRMAQKLIHASLTLASIGCIGFALWAVLTFHNLKAIPNFYSLHSWIGIATIGLCIFQWLMGCFAFLFTCCSEKAKARTMYLHRFLGYNVIVIAVATCLMGYLEKITFLQVAGLAKDSPASNVGNATGVLILAAGVSIMFVVYSRHYEKTKPLNEYTALDDEVNVN